jgi:hypothetical protein
MQTNKNTIQDSILHTKLALIYIEQLKKQWDEQTKTKLNEFVKTSKFLNVETVIGQIIPFLSLKFPLHEEAVLLYKQVNK